MMAGNSRCSGRMAYGPARLAPGRLDAVARYGQAGRQEARGLTRPIGLAYCPAPRVQSQGGSIPFVPGSCLSPGLQTGARAVRTTS